MYIVLKLIWFILQLTHTVFVFLPHLQLSCLEVPSAWRKVDSLREAQTAQLYFFENRSQRQLMEEVFFLKRLQTIRDFFKLCATFAQTISGKFTCLVFVTLRTRTWTCVPVCQLFSVGRCIVYSADTGCISVKDPCRICQRPFGDNQLL